MIKPTVGRRIWYWPSDYDRRTMQYNDTSQPCDAGVAYVHHDRLVNISVADQVGHVFSKTSVILLQDDDPIPTLGVGYAQWVPFQVGQAKKE